MTTTTMSSSSSSTTTTTTTPVRYQQHRTPTALPSQQPLPPLPAMNIMSFTRNGSSNVPAVGPRREISPARIGQEDNNRGRPSTAQPIPVMNYPPGYQGNQRPVQRASQPLLPALNISRMENRTMSGQPSVLPSHSPAGTIQPNAVRTGEILYLPPSPSSSVSSSSSATSGRINGIKYI